MKSIFAACLIWLSCSSKSITTFTSPSIDGYMNWITGHDASTTQLLPREGNDALVNEAGITIVHVKFQIKQYGEVAFPINTKTPAGSEALQVDLSKSKQIRITYQANQEFILQLRQTGVHGGVHNYITLPATEKYVTVTISFNEFKGGKTELDLKDVAKFNFAFLSNNEKDGFAELKIRSFIIEDINHKAVIRLIYHSTIILLIQSVKS